MCALAHAVMFGWHAFRRAAYAAGSNQSARVARVARPSASRPRGHTPITTPPPLTATSEKFTAHGSSARYTTRSLDVAAMPWSLTSTTLVAAQTASPARARSRPRAASTRLTAAAVASDAGPCACPLASGSSRYRAWKSGRVCAFGSAAAETIQRATASTRSS